LLLECNLSWLIIINNGDSSSTVLSLKWLVGISVVKLNEEILIWLPVIIVVNSNVDELLGITLIEGNNSIKSIIILSSFSLSIDSSDSD